MHAGAAIETYGLLSMNRRTLAVIRSSGSVSKDRSFLAHNAA
jgi:hypothetical protein